MWEDVKKPWTRNTIIKWEGLYLFMPGMIIKKDSQQTTEELAESIVKWIRASAGQEDHKETAYDRWMRNMHAK